MATMAGVVRDAPHDGVRLDDDRAGDGLAAVRRPYVGEGGDEAPANVVDAAAGGLVGGYSGSAAGGAGGVATAGSSPAWLLAPPPSHMAALLDRADADLLRAAERTSIQTLLARLQVVAERAAAGGSLAAAAPTLAALLARVNANYGAVVTPANRADAVALLSRGLASRRDVGAAGGGSELAPTPLPPPPPPPPPPVARVPRPVVLKVPKAAGSGMIGAEARYFSGVPRAALAAAAAAIAASDLSKLGFSTSAGTQSAAMAAGRGMARGDLWSPETEQQLFSLMRERLDAGRHMVEAAREVGAILARTPDSVLSKYRKAGRAIMKSSPGLLFGDGDGGASAGRGPAHRATWSEEEVDTLIPAMVLGLARGLTIEAAAAGLVDIIGRSQGSIAAQWYAVRTSPKTVKLRRIVVEAARAATQAAAAAAATAPADPAAAATMTAAAEVAGGEEGDGGGGEVDGLGGDDDGGGDGANDGVDGLLGAVGNGDGSSPLAALEGALHGDDGVDLVLEELPDV